MVLDREFPPDLRVENEMESLLGAGIQVDLACYTLKNRPAQDKWKGVRIFRKAISSFRYRTSVGALKFPFYFNFWRPFLDRLCRENQYDAIHVHDLSLARVGYEMKQKYGIFLVLDLHENWPALLDIAEHTQGLAGRLLSSGKQWRKYEKEFCQKADRLIVVVEEASDRLAGLGIDPGKIFNVSNLLNISDLEQLPPATEEGPFILFYGGGINRHRGLQNVVSAMPLVLEQDPRVELWIVGEGRYRKSLEELSKRLGTEEKVRFWGWKPYPEMMQLLSRSHAALIPHLRTEHTDSTIPHKLFQYMYLGKPVIASDCLPIKRILKETEAGLVYRSGNIQELAGMISKLSVDKGLFSKMKNSGITAVEELYNWSKSEATLLTLYKSLANTREV